MVGRSKDNRTPPRKAPARPRRALPVSRPDGAPPGRRAAVEVRPMRRVLIANRGEIALRILRACRESGLSTAMVYSEADRDTLPVRLADVSFCIGPAAAAA